MMIKNIAEYIFTKLPTAFPYWITAILTGVFAVGYAKLFHHTTDYTLAIYNYSPYLFLIITPLTFLLGWFFVYFIAPEASGSGIPQVLAAHKLEEQHSYKAIDRLLGVRTTLIKVLSSVLCLLGGGAIGREGPTVQIASSIFYWPKKFFKKRFPVQDHRTAIIAGGAAGIAAAFNTPLGGIIYAIEELAPANLNAVRSVLIIVVTLAGMMAQWISGPYLYLGFPKISEFTFSLIPLVILVGIISGFLGALFGRFLTILSLYRKNIKSAGKLALVAIGSGLAFALLVIFVDKNALGSGKEVLTDLLFQKDMMADFKLVFVRFFGSILSYLSGCAGGIFAPSLTIGASIGSYLATFFSSADSNLLTLFGMIGFLTGVTHTPFTAFVLVVEMTDRHQAIFPMMLAALCAQAVTKAFDKNSFYEHMKDIWIEQLNGPQLPPAEQKK